MMEHIYAHEVKNWKAELNAFGQHYNYDVSYLEALIDASPGAFQAFRGGMGMSRYQQAAPVELLMIAKISGMLAEDCGPCLELNIKMAREAGVAESVIKGVLAEGEGLSADHREIFQYAQAVATNGILDPDRLSQLEVRWGKEVMAEIALAIVSTRLYPTLKRALGYAQSCSLTAGLIQKE